MSRLRSSGTRLPPVATDRVVAQGRGDVADEAHATEVAGGQVARGGRRGGTVEGEAAPGAVVRLVPASFWTSASATVPVEATSRSTKSVLVTTRPPASSTNVGPAGAGETTATRPSLAATVIPVGGPSSVPSEPGLPQAASRTLVGKAVVGRAGRVEGPRQSSGLANGLGSPWRPIRSKRPELRCALCGVCRWMS